MMCCRFESVRTNAVQVATGHSVVLCVHVYCMYFVLFQAVHHTFSVSSKVEGSMLGKTLSATGSSTSMKGTTRKMMKGTSLKTSAVVLVNCFRSRLYP